MIDRLKREPAVVIGIVFAVVLAVVQTLVGEGVLGQDIGDTVTRALDPTAGWALPIVVAVITRFFVTSAAAPTIKEGTTVTVVTPPGEDNKEVVV